MPAAVPLSVMKIRIVFSASSQAASFSRKRPTFSSMLAIMP
jgi:hypothetical protein